MALIYKLAGYDPKTEELAVEHVIPDASVERAKLIAGISGRPEIIGDWPLSGDQACAIAHMIGVNADPSRHNWFLEPSASTVEARRTTAR
jgi:hypothetical protein